MIITFLSAQIESLVMSMILQHEVANSWDLRNLFIHQPIALQFSGTPTQTAPCSQSSKPSGVYLDVPELLFTFANERSWLHFFHLEEYVNLLVILRSG
jgi:hypothetical protein